MRHLWIKECLRAFPNNGTMMELLCFPTLSIRQDHVVEVEFGNMSAEMKGLISLFFDLISLSICCNPRFIDRRNDAVSSKEGRS